MSSTIQQNDVAPEFTLPDQDDKPVSLSDFRGSKVVLYFYPKDDTSGCTAQACDLRDNVREFEARDAVIIGVSPDSAASHRKFIGKHDLPYTLLADVGHQVAELYGVWAEKSMYGRKYWGVERTTFVIDEEGRILEVLRKVKPAEHVGNVLQLI